MRTFGVRPLLVVVFAILGLMVPAIVGPTTGVASPSQTSSIGAVVPQASTASDGYVDVLARD
ncbi:hypothetical protein, partial [Ornithinimicrobium kibberense]|uniref:hypothetical protein n=1 Tax=Ornithinimicrobium kibberense TaxID=282060 RepID=UPI001EE16118